MNSVKLALYRHFRAFGGVWWVVKKFDHQSKILTTCNEWRFVRIFQTVTTLNIWNRSNICTDRHDILTAGSKLQTNRPSNTTRRPSGIWWNFPALLASGRPFVPIKIFLFFLHYLLDTLLKVCYIKCITYHKREHLSSVFVYVL